MNKIALPREGGLINNGATFLGANFVIKESLLTGEVLGVPTNLNLTGATVILRLSLEGSFNTVVELKNYHGITVTDALEGKFKIDPIQKLTWQKGVWSGYPEILYPNGDRIPYKILIEITVS